MGTRFKKSIKICKGVRVNFSKSGASLSLGGRGHSMNFGSRGAKATFGIPGTGLSYSTNLGGSSHKRSSHSSHKKASSSKVPVQMPNQYGIHMNEKGQVLITDKNDIEIIDAAVIRKIKATPQYQSQVALLDKQRKEQIDKIVRNSSEENERFINLYKLTEAVDNATIFEQRLDAIQPEQFHTEEFTLPMPIEKNVRLFLKDEAKKCVKGSIFKVGKMRKIYINENLPSKLEKAMQDWETQKASFYDEQAERKKSFDLTAKEVCNQQKTFLRNLINGDENTVCEMFDTWIASCELPVEININYDWNCDNGIMMLDVDLPEIEDLATTKMTKTDSGNLKEKNKTQTEIRGEYATLTLGLAIFVVANAFNVSPAIKGIVISGYTQRRNKDGDICDDYIYSIKFPRGMFEGIDFTTINPQEYCFSAENRCNMTSTSLFKVITPYEAY